MRVGWLVPASINDRTGGNLFDLRVVSSLERAGHGVCLLPTKLDSWSVGFARSLFRGTGFEGEASLDHELAGLDLLLEDELCHPVLFRSPKPLVDGRRLPIISVVHHLRSSEPHTPLIQPLHRAVERAYLRRVDGFIFNSETTRASVDALCAIGGRPAVVARPGRDRLSPGASIVAENVANRAGDQGALRLVFVGNVIARKGLASLIRALAGCRSEVTLEVVGDLEVEPRETRRARLLVEEFGLTDRVRFHGPLPDDALCQLLAACHVLAVVSTWEGFGMVYAEAMGFGLPVLASRSGAAHEIVEDGVTGFLVPRDDRALLATRIDALASDRERLAEMALAALSAWRTMPTWDETGARIVRFLETEFAEWRAAAT